MPMYLHMLLCNLHVLYMCVLNITPTQIVDILNAPCPASKGLFSWLLITLHKVKMPHMVISSFKHEVTDTADSQVSKLMFKNTRLLSCRSAS